LRRTDVRSRPRLEVISAGPRRRLQDRWRRARCGAGGFHQQA
jgi:hypothetical protein